jgi:hypothetical protein
MQPGFVRAIEYEFVGNSQASGIGLKRDDLTPELRALSQLGVLRCVDHEGKRLTIVGDARQVRKMLANGEASDPDGIKVKQQLFPVTFSGWQPPG